MAKVLIHASNQIGKSMAGPGIRSWEFAVALSALHEVTLITPNQTDLQSDRFTIIKKSHTSIKEQLKNADILITQTLDPWMAFYAKYQKVKIIIDAYDPVPLELLEMFKHRPIKEQIQQNRLSLLRLGFNIEMADHLICASEKQRDLWLGLLLGKHRITPPVYAQDSNLRHFVDVVPFGISRTPPQKTAPGLREKYGFSQTDYVILWGGGIWNWFDPLSLIKAIKILSHHRKDIKLVFMGIKSPDSTPEMRMCHEAVHLARTLGLLDQSVFFNDGWIPYHERQNFLLDATIGVSTHFDHLETRYSFRTRMLDYIWAQLPILATKGDAFADLIERHHLGLVVPYQDEKALAEAITHMIDNPSKMATIKQNLSLIQKKFFWDEAITPLKMMIQQFTSSKDELKIKYRDFSSMLQFISQYSFIKIQEKGIKNCIKRVLGCN